MAAQMDADDRIPFLDRHVENHAVAQNAGDVHQDVELAEFLDRLVDQTLAAFRRRDVEMIGGGFAAPGLELLDHVICRRRLLLLSRDGNAEIVDHHGRALRRKCSADFASDSSSAASHGRYFAFQMTTHRRYLPAGTITCREITFALCFRLIAQIGEGGKTISVPLIRAAT